MHFHTVPVTKSTAVFFKYIYIFKIKNKKIKTASNELFYHFFEIVKTEKISTKFPHKKEII
jgi:hypothetical protein